MTEKIQTGEDSLDKWVAYFSQPQEKQDNLKFIKLLKKLDKRYLTETPVQLSTFEYPENGLLEDTFKKIAFDEENATENEKAKIVLALISGVNMKPWLSLYHEKFYEVLEKSLIEGNYEQYGIEAQEAIKQAVGKEYLEKGSFVGVAMLRGMALGTRYPDSESEKALEKLIKKNKMKGFFVF